MVGSPVCTGDVGVEVKVGVNRPVGVTLKSEAVGVGVGVAVTSSLGDVGVAVLSWISGVGVGVVVIFSPEGVGLGFNPVADGVSVSAGLSAGVWLIRSGRVGDGLGPQGVEVALSVAEITGVSSNPPAVTVGLGSTGTGTGMNRMGSCVG